jgi:hypothetical protein
MNKGKIIDIFFILLFFGIYIIILNIDKNTDNCRSLGKYIWLPMIIAYFIGRFVTLYLIKKDK